MLFALQEEGLDVRDVQQVMLNLLTPRILGHSVRMPAMLVIIAVVLGARLAGIAGALLGVPTMGVIYAFAVHYGTRIRERREARENEERVQDPARPNHMNEDAVPVGLTEPFDGFGIDGDTPKERP